MILNISTVEIGGKRRVKVANEGGVPFYTGEFKSHTDYIRASNRLKIKETDLDSALKQFFASGLEQLDVELTGLTKAEVNAYLIRDELGSAQESFSSFKEAFTTAKPNQVIEWQSKELTCCLDIDFTKPLDMERILSLFSSIQPAPLYFWVSKSGQGLHAIYELYPPYTADDLAAIAAYRFHTMEPTAGLELLCRTRMPPKASGKKKDMTFMVHGSGTQAADFTLDNLLYSQSEGHDLTQIVCEMFEYEVGKRYPHTMCPVNPSVRSSTNSDPVVVHEDHVYCFICHADHLFHGHRAAGYFPFSALAGLARETNIKTCVDHFVHWGHAQFSFTGAFKFAKLLYKALLKSRHGDDPRIPAAINHGEPIGMVRRPGFWADYHGTVLDVKPNSARIFTMPKAQYIDGKNGKVSVDRTATEWLASKSDLSKYGYKAVNAIHGFHMTQLQELPDNKIFAVLSGFTLPSNKQARFLAGRDRMPAIEAWGILENIFPGIRSELITALMIGRGCSEHRAGLSPMLFITGVTGSGKSTHVEIAAAIFGDTVSKIQMNRDKDRFFNSLMNGKQRSGFVFFDEFFKNSRLQKMGDVESMEMLLGFEDNQEVYMIYEGAVSLGDLPMFVWADADGIPDEVWLHEQVGRRVYHYHLESKLEWGRSLAISGILEPKKLRINGNEKVIHACNSILSDVLEMYFTTPATDFKVVEDIGFKLLEVSDKRATVNLVIKQLFDEVCKLPDRKPTIIDPRAGMKVMESLEMFQILQTTTERGTARCRALVGNDLSQILGLKIPCKVETELKAGRFAIRFVSYDGKVINEKLRTR